MPARLLLSQSIYQALITHARAQLPHEACGLLRGREEQVTGFLPARNVSPTPRSDYEVDAETLLRALSWEDEGDELIAIFHSHPTSPAFPSLIDAARAFYPDSVYLILSLQRPHDPELKGYFLRPEAIFRGEQADALRQETPFLQVRPGLWGYRLTSSKEPPSLPRLRTRADADLFLVYDRPTGPIRLITVQPVEILLQF